MEIVWHAVFFSLLARIISISVLEPFISQPGHAAQGVLASGSMLVRCAFQNKYLRLPVSSGGWPAVEQWPGDKGTVLSKNDAMAGLATHNVKSQSAFHFIVYCDICHWVCGYTCCWVAVWESTGIYAPECNVPHLTHSCRNTFYMHFVPTMMSHRINRWGELYLIILVRLAKISPYSIWYSVSCVVAHVVKWVWRGFPYI